MRLTEVEVDHGREDHVEVEHEVHHVVRAHAQHLQHQVAVGLARVEGVRWSVYLG